MSPHPPLSATDEDTHMANTLDNDTRQAVALFRTA